jgi:hypothetical protein
MVSLVRFMAAMVVGLLPRQYRSRWGWASDASLRVPTICSGLAEAVISLGLKYDLVIASCRPKPGWNRLITVEYEDQLYELFDEKKGVAPRPHIYQLRKLSPGRIIRGLHHYHPDEMLTEKQRMALSKEAAAQEKNQT